MTSPDNSEEHGIELPALTFFRACPEDVGLLSSKLEENDLEEFYKTLTEGQKRLLMTAACELSGQDSDFRKQAYHKLANLVALREIEAEQKHNKSNSNEFEEADLAFDKKGGRRPPADILYDLARKSIESIIRDTQTNEIYAVCLRGNQKKILNTESQDFESFLRQLYEAHYEKILDYHDIIKTAAKTRADYRKGKIDQTVFASFDWSTYYRIKDIFISDKHERVISEHNVKNVIAQLISKIDKEQALQNRVFWDRKNKHIYYNLADSEGNIIEISPDKDGRGVKTLKNSDLLLFKTLDPKKAQVMPSLDYDENRRYLRDLTASTKFKFEHHRTIDEVYALSLLIPGIEHPVYFPYGEPNSGKSTLQILKKSLVDPLEDRNASSYEDVVSLTLTELETDDRKSWDRALEIESNYITYFDNVSFVSPKIMDECCRWVQPGFHKTKEKKYLNKELSEIGGKRPIGLNGLVNTITAGDLMSRVFAPELFHDDNDHIAHDGIEVEHILESFFKNKSLILGYMLGIISKFLYYYEDMRKKIVPKARLKHFEIACEILSRCVGNEKGKFQEEWAKNTEDQNEATIESSTLAKVLISYVQSSKNTRVEKQPEDLFRELQSLARTLGYDPYGDFTFPKDASRLTQSLNKLTVQLRASGIEVVTGERNSTGQRIIILINNGARPSEPENQETFEQIANELASRTLDHVIDHDLFKQRLISGGTFSASEAEYSIQHNIRSGLLEKVDYHKYKVRHEHQSSEMPGQPARTDFA